MSKHMPHGHLIYRAYADSSLGSYKWRYDEHADGTVLRYERGTDGSWWPGEPVPWIGY